MAFKKCSSQPKELVEFNRRHSRVTLVLVRDAEWNAWGVRVSQEGKAGSCIVEGADKQDAIDTGVAVGRDLLRISARAAREDADGWQGSRATRTGARAQWQAKKVTPFTQGDIHVWQGTAEVLVSVESIRDLRGYTTWDAAVNGLHLREYREAARALDAHVKNCLL